MLSGQCRRWRALRNNVGRWGAWRTAIVLLGVLWVTIDVAITEDYELPCAIYVVALATTTLARRWLTAHAAVVGPALTLMAIGIVVGTVVANYGRGELWERGGVGEEIGFLIGLSLLGVYLAGYFWVFSEPSVTVAD